MSRVMNAFLLSKETHWLPLTTDSELHVPCGSIHVFIFQWVIGFNLCSDNPKPIGCKPTLMLVYPMLFAAGSFTKYKNHLVFLIHFWFNCMHWRLFCALQGFTTEHSGSGMMNQQQSLLYQQQQHQQQSQQRQMSPQPPHSPQQAQQPNQEPSSPLVSSNHNMSSVSLYFCISTSMFHFIPWKQIYFWVANSP